MEPTRGRENTSGERSKRRDERASPKGSEQKHPTVGTRTLLQQRDVLGGHGLPRRRGHLLRAQGERQRRCALHLRADRRPENSRGRRAIHRLVSVSTILARTTQEARSGLRCLGWGKAKGRRRVGW